MEFVNYSIDEFLGIFFIFLPFWFFLMLVFWKFLYYLTVKNFDKDIQEDEDEEKKKSFVFHHHYHYRDKRY